MAPAKKLQVRGCGLAGWPGFNVVQIGVVGGVLAGRKGTDAIAPNNCFAQPVWGFVCGCGDFEQIIPCRVGEEPAEQDTGQRRQFAYCLCIEGGLTVAARAGGLG